MPIKIYSKTEQEKHNAFIERMYQGMTFEGKNKEDLKVIDPDPSG